MSLPSGVTRAPSGVLASYLYRGARVSRPDRAGTWRGEMGSIWTDDRVRIHASTLRHLVYLIDRHLDAPAEAP